jgi:hypothetical protein
MARFRLDPTADTAGTHWLTDVDLVPADLVRQFGQPQPSSRRLVSGEYWFVGEAGQVFTLYDDWSVTHPSPEQFWESHEPQTFAIGGHRRAHAYQFIVWLQAQLANTGGDLA